MRRPNRPPLLAAGLVAGVLSFGLVLAVVTEEGRGPAMAAMEGVSEDGRTLAFSVNSCHGDPEAAITAEDSSRVVVRVVSDIQTGANDGCADGVRVRLREPLGNRQVIDAATDRPAPRSQGCCRMPTLG